MLSLPCHFAWLFRHCVLGLLCTLSLLPVCSDFAMLLLLSLLSMQCKTSGFATQYQWGLLSMLSLLCMLSCCVALYLMRQLTALLPCLLRVL